jgi:hypothetical protein
MKIALSRKKLFLIKMVGKGIYFQFSDYALSCEIYDKKA